ncbi:MAG TPA: D-glycerate dehydrogenase [Myxococcota bacterium]|nr:D-glycerate dehydrogenase [Myxococcota bacterium]
MEQRVYVTREIPEASLRRLAEGLPGAHIDVHRGPAPLAPDALARAARGSCALVCTLADRIDAALLEALAPALRVVATFAVGYENIDLDAARRLGVHVANTPGVLTDATAEVAVALALACARRVAEGDRFVRADRFAGWGPLAHLGHSVYGSAVGIVGAGRIGLRVAAAFRRGFDCTILVHSRRAPASEWAELGARAVPLDELLERSDIVSLHCPLSRETHHLIDARALARMKPTAVLVNTARGAIVDEAALVAALRAGAIACAGLDVYEDEPRLAPGLAALENAVLLPHIGSATHAAREAMGHLCADAVIAELSGRAAAHRLV